MAYPLIILFSVVFLVIALAHSLQLIRYRTWWMGAMVVGLYGEHATPVTSEATLIYCLLGRCSSC